MFERVYNKTHFRKVLNQALEEERLGFKNGGSAKLYTVKKGTQAGTVTEKVPYNQVPKSIRNAAKKYGYTLQKWLDLPFNEKRNVIAKFSSKEKYAKPFEFTIAGKKYNVKIPGLKKSSIAKYQELLKGVEEWKLNPTPQNWARIFRTSSNQQTELSKQLRRYITGKPVQGVKEPGQIAKKVFDLINIKQIIGPQLNELKNYDSKLFANLRTSFGATQAASDKQLITSAKEIKKINTQFKKNPEINLEDLTKNIYRSKFTKSSPTEKLKLLTKVSDGVARYLEALEGGRTKFVKIEKPDLKTTKKIVDNIKDNTSGFRFREGTLRNYKFAIRDSLLKL